MERKLSSKRPSYPSQEFSLIKGTPPSFDLIRNGNQDDGYQRGDQLLDAGGNNTSHVEWHQCNDDGNIGQSAVTRGISENQARESYVKSEVRLLAIRIEI